MPVMLDAPESMVQSINDFSKTERLPFAATAGEAGGLKVVASQAGRESTPTELHAGGSITCGLARDLAGRLGVKTREIGKLLNHLDIKIRACELGCFE
jgi:hypothetical protein